MLRDKTENINDHRVTSHRRPTARRKKEDINVNVTETQTTISVDTQVPSY